MRMIHRLHAAGRRRAQKGLGIVEMLVGIAVGLFVIGGGLLMFSSFVDSDRRLVLESRLMQDLRVVSDIITRDVRRGGYWRNASSSIWTSGGGTPPRNPYANVRLGACSATTAASVPTGNQTAACYWISRDGDNVSADNERYGFELDGGIIYSVREGGQRTALTDPNAINVTNLRFDWGTGGSGTGVGTQVIDARDFCPTTCTANCPTVVVREVEVTIRGTVPGDTSIARQLRSNVKLRNDNVTGQCPT